MTGDDEPKQPRIPDPLRRLDAELDQLGEQLEALNRAKNQLQGLLNAVLAISRELELSTVLHRVVTTAMDLVGARYGALGVLHESGGYLTEFITAGLSTNERAGLAGVEFPRGRGVLGHLIHHPEPLRVDDIGSHPASVGFPPGHPQLRTLLGVAISVRGEIYGDLYLSERNDGRPFDRADEGIVVAVAGIAGIAIENARLFSQIRDSDETFQRLLLPVLPDLRPVTVATIYRPAAEPARLGGDWYDALVLPDNVIGVVIGDVVGHDLHAAAAMAQTRSMLRALFYDRRTPPSEILTRLDRTLRATTTNPITTVLLARIEPEEPGGWTLYWSSAGHFPPLVIVSGQRAEYLQAEPGLPLGVSPERYRLDHRHRVPKGCTVVFFTDGLIEHPAHPIDEGLDSLVELATAHAGLPLQDFVQALADRHPSDGHDDMAILALRLPRSL